MSIKIPVYMRFQHDPKARKATLQVENSSAREQREMWGQSSVLTRFEGSSLTPPKVQPGHT